MNHRLTLGLAVATLSGALAPVAPVWANQTYLVDVPTAEPYTRFENHVAKGSFTDQFQFSLDQVSDGYIWLFARQDAWLGYNLIENTKSVSLTLRNNTTQETWEGALYPSVEGKVSWLTPGVLPMVKVGFDPNKSLYISGEFGAGDYTATVSGIATGWKGSSYITKFSFTPAVPEPTTWALSFTGLALVAGMARARRKAVA